MKIGELQQNISLANHTTFRIGGAAKYFTVVKNKEEFIKVLRMAKEKEIKFFIMGGGSNLLISDDGYDGLVIKVKGSGIKTIDDKEHRIMEVEAGIPLAKIISETIKDNYSGIEWGFGIPGTIGGAIFGNAGRLGQDISGAVRRVNFLDINLDEKEIGLEECEFAYRESRFKKTKEIIVGAEMIFMKNNKDIINKTLSEAKEVVVKSPKFPSAGCIFKNYCLGNHGNHLLKNHPELSERVRKGKIGIGYLIDQCGLKGKTIGGAKIWEGHANYIINIGKAKSSDVDGLISLCRENVKEKFGIELEEEIIRLNF